MPTTKKKTTRRPRSDRKPAKSAPRPRTATFRPPAITARRVAAPTKPRIGDELLRPGPHVGGSTPADDRLPEQMIRRGQLIREGARGRTEPRRYKTRSRGRRTQDAGGYRPTAARAQRNR
jgi:hypothetical protein